MEISFIGLVLVIFMFEISLGDQKALLYSPGDSGEYCLNEEFQATCLKNEVIIVDEAAFGRMKVGRCLQNEGAEMVSRLRNDPRFLGCSVDVLSLVDEKCFGKNQCTVRILYDIDQYVTKTCHEGLKSYLQATYSCASVVEPDRTCTVSVTSLVQHLMNFHSSSTQLSCGSRHQPWKLEAPAGQQINVSLLVFGGAVNQRERDCRQYGYILDREANRNVSICAPHANERSNFIYQSQTSELYVVFADEFKSDSQKPLRVLIRIEAVGCTDVLPPEDMWLRRRNQEAVVGCYSSRQTWYLNCVNNQWLGVIGNCTRELRDKVVLEIPGKVSSVQNEVLVAVSIAVIGVIICVSIIICGVVCMKRYKTMMKMEIPARHVEKIHNGGWQADSGNTPFLQQNRQLI